MYWSRYNIITRAGEEFAILNPLSGNFDFFSAGEKPAIDRIREESVGAGTAGPETGPAERIKAPPAGEIEADSQAKLAGYLAERGYLFNSRGDEERLLRKKHLEFEMLMAETPTQILLVPTYGCNLACSYCFQKDIRNSDLITREAVDAFFKHIETHHRDKPARPFITLFGGEPLVNSPAQREIISYIVGRAMELGYELAAVTNGFDLIDYVDVLKGAKIREIQVTVDGPREVHDARRATANGKGTFDRIIAGIGKAIEAGFPINFRVVLDRDNVGALVPLAELLDQRGWLDLGPERFKTQIGRNYELFDCSVTPQSLMTEVDLWRAVIDLAAEHPIVGNFHRPEFKGIGYLAETGELYTPTFDTCPAYKSEWVYDLHGDIYGCTASCGRREYRGGTFYPETTLDRTEIEQWERRDILNIPECRECDAAMLCGGGCGVMGRNRHGRVLGPDCRPVKELLELGVEYYSAELARLAS